MLRIRKMGAATTAAVVLGGALAGTAGAAGIGPGTGPSSFPLQPLTTGASDSPRVMVLDDGSALAAFDTFAALPSGQIRVCLVAPVPAAACAGPGPILTPGSSGASDLALHPGLGPNSVLLTNGTANFTELYSSSDRGATFAGPLQISNYANAEDFAILPDGNLLLVGRGNDSQSNSVHVVVVPPDGSGLNTQGFWFPGDYPSSQRGVAYNGGRYVVLGGGFLSIGSQQTQITYAVYNGSGDPNAAASWTQGTVPLNFSDPPNIADGPSGVVLVALDDKGNVVASKLSGTTFPAPVKIADPAGKAYLPNVTQDATGRITATWQVNGVGLRAAVSLDGTHWTKPFTINRDRQYETDTATAAPGNGLAVTRASRAYVATRLYARVTLTLKPAKKKITAGDQATLTATLTDQAGKGIGGAKVALRVGKKTVSTATTGASGAATFKVAPKKTRRYVATYAGTAVNASYTSTTAKVTVKKAG